MSRVSPFPAHKEIKMLYKGMKYPNPIMASDVVPKEVTWLWYPYFPTGSASMIFGPGGSGKSHIAVDIAARITTGRAFPGQKTPLPAQPVLMLGAEDEADRVLVPRLIKAGADLSKVAILSEPLTIDKNGIEVIEKYIENFSAGIVFVDPLVAYIGGKVDLNRANETRVFTGGLHQLAIKTGTPIIVVHHARKGNEGAEFERMMGSADFSNAVRSVLFTTQAPNGDRIMKHVKANYAPLGPTLGYQFGDTGFEWTGAYEDTGVKGGHAAPKVNEVHDWLRKMLADGPKRAVDMEQSASKLGFSHRAVVRGKVGVAESYLISVNGKMSWYWKLLEKTNETEVPIMGAQWKPENTAQDREIIARTEERARRVSGKVGASGPSDDDLSKWMKENL
jgi:hypothetical protein